VAARLKTVSKQYSKRSGISKEMLLRTFAWRLTVLV
jgi:hypothetical protein